MLEVADLQSFYGSAHVIQGASLTVREKEAVALLGRNGMGKTTLIRSIMGLTPPDVRGGSVKWKGEEILGLPPMTPPPDAQHVADEKLKLEAARRELADAVARASRILGNPGARPSEPPPAH